VWPYVCQAHVFCKASTRRLKRIFRQPISPSLVADGGRLSREQCNSRRPSSLGVKKIVFFFFLKRILAHVIARSRWRPCAMYNCGRNTISYNTWNTRALGVFWTIFLPFLYDVSFLIFIAKENSYRLKLSGYYLHDSIITSIMCRQTVFEIGVVDFNQRDPSRCGCSRCQIDFITETTKNDELLTTLSRWPFSINFYPRNGVLL